MKAIDTPRTGKIANQVAYPSPYGLCYRELVVPRDPKTPAQSRIRLILGSSSSEWGLKLTEDQREHWITAALSVPSFPSLRQYSHLTGQQFWVKINATLRAIGKAPLDEPPAPVAFPPSPAGALSINTDPDGGVRLLLGLGPVSTDIMLFGQAPCNAGRMKHRRVYYLGLLGPATNGQCDVTALYTARFGQPRPGQKVFLVTCQQQNGWRDQDCVVSAIVPSAPLPAQPETTPDPQPAAAEPIAPPEPQQAAAEASSSVSRAVYMGSTLDAPGVRTGQSGVHPLSTLCTPLVHGSRMDMATLRALAMSNPIWRSRTA